MRLKHIAIYGLAILAISSCALARGYQPPERRYYISTVFSWWPTYTDMTLFRKFVDESKRKGANSIGLDIPWSVEQSDGRYDFTEPDKRIDYAVNQGMSVFLRINTTTTPDSKPEWMTDSMLQCTPDGKVFKRNTDAAALPSLSHPTVKEQIVKFARAASSHYGSRYKLTISGEYPIMAISPAFDLYMESQYCPDADLDYSPAAQACFAKWVKSHYKSLDNLNSKWGEEYASWNDVVLKNAPETAKQLFFESELKTMIDLFADAVQNTSGIPVGLYAGNIWDNPHSRTLNVTPLLNKITWLFVSDAPEQDHAFSTDYARSCAPGKRIASAIDAATHAEATNGRYYNQGVRAFEHGASAVSIVNWDLSNIRDNNRWPFLHFVGKLTRYPTASPKPDRAMYVSTWDLILRVSSINDYLAVYKTLSDGGKLPVDVLPDYIIASDPGRLSRYKEIHLPANWTIPPDVRKALMKVQDKLKINKPLVAGTLDEYGRPEAPLAK